METRAISGRLSNAVSYQVEISFIGFHNELCSLRLEDCESLDDFYFKQITIQQNRDATGITMTNDLEALAAIGRNMPEYLLPIHLNWIVNDFEGVSAANALARVQFAMQHHKPPVQENRRRGRGKGRK